ncbi:MAG: hypothetical protein AVDCRST_MAG26-2606, partial [uncultured Chloroflexia bacterium]
ALDARACRRAGWNVDTHQRAGRHDSACRSAVL